MNMQPESGPDNGEQAGNKQERVAVRTESSGGNGDRDPEGMIAPVACWLRLRIDCGGGRWLRRADGRDETVSAARNGLDVARAFGRIAEPLPEPVHHSIQAVIKIDERAFRPELRSKLFPADQLSCVLQKRSQNSNGLPVQPDFDTT